MTNVGRVTGLPRNRIANHRRREHLGTGAMPLAVDRSHFPSLPRTLAARVEFATNMLLGAPIVDDDGNLTGEHSGPLITRAQYLEMIDVPDVDE